MKLILTDQWGLDPGLIVKTEDKQTRCRLRGGRHWRYRLEDASGEAIAFFQQERFPRLPTCHVKMGETCFTVVREYPTPPMFRFDGVSWKAEGDLFRREYILEAEGRRIATMHRHPLTPGSRCTLEIPAPADEQDALVMAACVHLLRK